MYVVFFYWNIQHVLSSHCGNLIILWMDLFSLSSFVNVTMTINGEDKKTKLQGSPSSTLSAVSRHKPSKLMLNTLGPNLT